MSNLPAWVPTSRTLLNYVQRMRAWCQQVEVSVAALESAEADPVNQVWVTYHDAAIDARPDLPTGDGTSGGWHLAASEDSHWMSQKIAVTASAGAWGSVLAMTGADGADGATGDSLYVEYSSTGTGTPDTDPGDWHAVFVEGDKFISEKVGTAGTWSAAKRIVGERGFSMWIAYHTNAYTLVPTRPTAAWDYRKGQTGANGWQSTCPAAGAAWLAFKATQGWPPYDAAGVNQQTIGKATAADVATWNDDAWSAPVLVKGDRGPGVKTVRRLFVQTYTAKATTGYDDLQAGITTEVDLGAYAVPDGWKLNMVTYTATLRNITFSPAPDALSITECSLAVKGGADVVAYGQVSGARTVMGTKVSAVLIRYWALHQHHAAPWSSAEKDSVELEVVAEIELEST